MDRDFVEWDWEGIVFRHGVVVVVVVVVTAD